MTIVLFLLILSLLVFVHELGHFVAARRFGMPVEEFGFGFPPRLWGIKKGGTLFSINLIPFGGFVRIEGETTSTNPAPKSFAAATLPKKLLVLAAGVFMNYLLGWVLFTGVLINGVTQNPADVPAGQAVKVDQRRIELFVTPDSPAAKAGLQTGDQLVSANGQIFASTDELIAYTKEQQRPILRVTAQRHGQTIQAEVTPRAASGDDPAYGFGVESLARVRYAWLSAPWYGLQTTATLTAQTFVGFGQVIRTLVTTGQVSQDVSGPVGIAVLTGQVRQLGFSAILQFIGILSVSLAVINFLPLPALDGGRAGLAIIERTRRRPLNPRFEQVFHATGFYLLIALLIAISVRDVQKFNVVSRLIGLFQ